MLGRQALRHVRLIVHPSIACRRHMSQATAAKNLEKLHEEFKGRPLYLDAQATTPLDPRVLDAMLPYLMVNFGNPHSRTHAYGWESEKAMEDARRAVAAIINADPREIIFTSGATESNNISIKGTRTLNSITLYNRSFPLFLYTHPWTIIVAWNPGSLLIR